MTGLFDLVWSVGWTSVVAAGLVAVGVGVAVFSRPWVRQKLDERRRRQRRKRRRRPEGGPPPP